MKSIPDHPPLARLARAGRHSVSVPRATLAAAALACLVAFGFQGTRGLYASTEGRYAEVAREMLASGNYLEPTLGGSPHWTKPPLTYAAIAASMRVFGVNTWAARLPGALAFIAAAGAVGVIGWALWDRTTGALAALIYATAPFPAIAAHVVSTDTLLTLWEIVAVMGYALAVRAARAERPRPARRAVRLMWGAFGLAFATKGPVGLLPLLGILPWHRRQAARPRVLEPVALGAFVVLGGWWYVVVCVRHPELLGYFVGDEVFGRVLTEQAHRNPEWYKPLLLYVPPLAFGLGPWLVLAHRAIWSRPLRWRARLGDLLRTARPMGLMALWLLLPLAVFTLSQSRLTLYVLPLMAPIALAVARASVAHREGAGLRRADLALAAVVALGIVAGKGAAARISSQNDLRALAELVRPLADARTPCYVTSRDYDGLAFYVDSPVECVSRGGDRSWAAHTLEEIVAAAARDATEQPVVVVTKHGREGNVTSAIAKYDLTYEVVQNAHWTAFRVMAPRPRNT